MKRDFDLIREILLNIEEHNFSGMANEMVFEAHAYEKVAYHAHLLWDGGYIDATNATLLGDGPNVYIHKLTWKGHDFLDAIRDANLWEKTKTLIRVKGLTLTFEAIKAAVPIALKAMFTGS